MTTWQLNRLNTEAFACRTSEPLRLDRPVIAAEDVRGGNGRPDSQGTSLHDRLPRIHQAHGAQGPLAHLGRTVVEQKMESDQLVFGGVFADPLGVEHLRIIVYLIEQTLSDLGKDAGQKHKPLYATPLWNKREKQATGRMRHDNRIVAMCRQDLRNDVGILRGTCLWLVGRQIHCHRVVTAALQLWNEQIPAGGVLG